MDGWMDGGRDGWMDRWMDGWMEGGMDGWRDGGMDAHLEVAVTLSPLLKLWPKPSWSVVGWVF